MAAPDMSFLWVLQRVVLHRHRVFLYEKKNMISIIHSYKAHIGNKNPKRRNGEAEISVDYRN